MMSDSAIRQIQSFAFQYHVTHLDLEFLIILSQG